jgi:hypothetical protein
MLNPADIACFETLKTQDDFFRSSYITSIESHQTFLQNYPQILCFMEQFCYMRGLSQKARILFTPKFKKFTQKLIKILIVSLVLIMIIPLNPGCATKTQRKKDK